MSIFKKIYNFKTKTDIDDKSEIDTPDQLAYTALGFFDGVHLGHQTLLNLCVKKSKIDNAISTVVIFDPHPEKIIYGLDDFPLLTPLEEKIQRIKKMSIQQVFVVDFNSDFFKISPENFINNILLKKLNMGAVFVGYNYRFGYKKRGDTDLIRKIGQKQHYKSYIIEPVIFSEKKERISSTNIKGYLKKGEIEKANQLLGYPYQIIGEVVHGDKRGNSVLSFPTANIAVPKDKLLPKHGVYIAITEINKKKYPSLVNIGFRPSFIQSKNRTTVEIHIFDFNKSIYGKNISTSLLRKIRDEIKFKNIKDLSLQIKKDKKVAIEYFEKI